MKDVQRRSALIAMLVAAVVLVSAAPPSPVYADGYSAVDCTGRAAVPLDSIPIPAPLPALKNCASDQPIANNNITPDTGSQSKLDQSMTQGLLFYLGANDGLDNGEHDGFSGNN